MAAFLSVYLASTLSAILLTPLVIRLAHRIGAVDRPGVRAVHAQPIPRIGGVAIFLAAMVPIVLASLTSGPVGEALRQVQRQFTTVLGAAVFVFSIGLIDDLRGLPARVKFSAELLAAVALCLAGVRIDDIAITDDLVLHLGGWGWLLTILWVVGITNAVNISDGLDGLAAGISVIACAVIAALSLCRDDTIMVIFAIALLGSLCGFLVFNFNPAKIFMGDCGSLFLGFTLAAASVMCVAKSAALVGLTLPALALGIPIFDTLFSILRRFLERRSLFAPDRSHLHHRLLDMGLHQRHVVLMIYLATLLAAGLGMFMIISEDLLALLLFGCVLLLLLLLFRVVGVVSLRKTLALLQRKYSSRRREREDRKVFEDLELHFRRAGNGTQWWQAICNVASGMDVAWISLRTIHADREIEENLWRSPETAPQPPRIVTMTTSFGDGDCAVPCQFEIAIRANGSLEAAARRAMLFGRLLDEHGVVTNG